MALRTALFILAVIEKRAWWRWQTATTVRL
jgi:hypothetical protein